MWLFFFFFQAEDGIRDYKVTGVQTCALPISRRAGAVRDPGLGRFALERDVDTAALARQPVEQAPAHLDQVIEGSLPGAVEVRRDGRQWGAGRKWQVDGFAQGGRGEGAGDEIGEG